MLIMLFKSQCVLAVDYIKVVLINVFLITTSVLFELSTCEA